MMALTDSQAEVAIVNSIRLVNEGTDTGTVDPWIKRGTGDAYRISPTNLSRAAGHAFLADSELTMDGVTLRATRTAFRGRQDAQVQMGHPGPGGGAGDLGRECAHSDAAAKEGAMRFESRNRFPMAVCSNELSAGQQLADHSQQNQT
jgi:hypothetical protein